MIKKDTVIKIHCRSRSTCENPECRKPLLWVGGELHHNYYRSQYKMDDRDEERNLSLLCATCHRDNVKGVHGKNRKLRKYLQSISDIRKPPEKRSTTPISRKHEVVQKKIKLRKTEEQKEKDRKFAKIRRQNQVEIFKTHHNGLTPSQYIYQQRKKYIQNNKAILSHKKDISGQ